MSIHVSVIDKYVMLNLYINKNGHGLLLNVNDYIYNIYHKPLADFNKCKSVENKKFKKKKQPKGNTSVPVQIIWTKEKQEETS